MTCQDVPFFPIAIACSLNPPPPPRPQERALITSPPQKSISLPEPATPPVPVTDKSSILDQDKLRKDAVKVTSKLYYKCKICKRHESSDLSGLHKHMTEEHHIVMNFDKATVKAWMHACRLCGKDTDLTQLKSHLDQDHGMGCTQYLDHQ